MLFLLLLYLNSSIFSVPHSFIFQTLSYPKQKKAFSKFFLKLSDHVRMSKYFPKTHRVSNQCLLCITCSFPSSQAHLWHQAFLNCLVCFLLAVAEHALSDLWETQSCKLFSTSLVTRSDYSSCTNNVGNGFFLH